MRSSIQIQQEVERRLGFFPPFFEPALASPAVLENLWQQTLSAYLDSPFCALFKEKLSALLSRYCFVPYCMICHSASLRPLGMTAPEVLKLLETPSGTDQDGSLGDLSSLADSLPSAGSSPAEPIPGSAYEQALQTCAIHLFLKTEQVEFAQSILLRLLGDELYQRFIAYLAYIDTCRLWVESHPEIAYEADQRVKGHLPALLDAEPALLAFFQDYQLRFAAQQSSRTENRRRSRGERRFRAAFENAAAGVAIVSLDGRLTEANPAYSLLTGYSHQELIGMDIHALIHPEDHREIGLQIGRLMSGEVPSFTIEKRIVQKNGGVIFSRNNVSLVRDPSGQAAEIMVVAQDVTEQRRDLESAAGANRQIVNILESVPDAFCTLDREWRYTYVSPRAERLLRRTKEELLGSNIWEMFPGLDETPVYEEYHRAIREQTPSIFETYYELLGGWYEIHIHPYVDGLSTYFHEITARKEAEASARAGEERYRLLVEGARDYAMLMTDADGCFTYINPGAERIFGWTGDELMGRQFGTIFTREDRADGIPEREMERARLSGLAEDTRWHTRENNTLFWAVGVTRCLYDESGAVSGYAKVIRDATDQKLAEDELAALHALNVSVLESIDDAFYSVDTDWHFTYVNSRAAAWLGRTSKQLVGRLLWELYPLPPDDHGQAILRQAMQDRQAVTFEARTSIKGVWLETSAFPMPDGLTIYFRDISERHESQAAQDALLSHEQNIATQLQLALQPTIPEQVPGLAIAKYYKAALDEAGVGGDFYDVFPISSHCTALIVGDLSGKGLAAAAQVAAVRNMLRFALYNSESLAGAVTRLNATIEANNLLAGFSTLFVGCYDSRSRALNYVNCAQEPALLMRANDDGAGTRANAEAAVEQLLPTGTVLGSFPNSEFEQVSYTLNPGDALAIFTDGLTESGPSRRDLLDIEGVTRLLAKAADPTLLNSPDAQTAAETICVRLIDSVDAYAGKGMRDDVCLLIAVAKSE